MPHASIGSSRWQPVDKPEHQHVCMRLAVENMSPSTVIVDEISTEQEAEAARTISQRGVQLIATVHGQSIAELINDKERSGSACSTIFNLLQPCHGSSTLSNLDFFQPS